MEHPLDSVFVAPDRLFSLPQVVQDPWKSLCFFIVLCRALFEVVISIFTYPFVDRKEQPELAMQETSLNKYILQACPALSSFQPAWWACGPFSQTMAASFTKPHPSKYTREMLTLSDNVEVALDWKAKPGFPDDAPVVVALHGLGGCSDSRYLELFSDCCIQQGWRCIVYNRRGHGGTSLLPKSYDRKSDSTRQPSKEPLLTPPAVTGPALEQAGKPGSASSLALEPMPGAAGAVKIVLTPSPGDVMGITLQLQPVTSVSDGIVALPVEVLSKSEGAGHQQDSKSARNSTPGGAPGTHTGTNSCDRQSSAAGTSGRVVGPGCRVKVFPRHCDLDDMSEVVDYVCSRYPKAAKLLIGFSAGGNLAANFQALRGASTPFKAAVSMCNGYDINPGTKIIAETSWVCDGIALSFIKDLMFEGRLPECKQLAKQAGYSIDWKKVMKTRSLRDFDELLVAPCYGFSSLQEYYDHDSCMHRLQDVRAPLLCLANWDDPLIDESIPRQVMDKARQLNPHMLVAVTQRGGHLGWYVGGGRPAWGHQTAVQFFTAVLNSGQEAV